LAVDSAFKPSSCNKDGERRANPTMWRVFFSPMRELKDFAPSCQFYYPGNMQADPVTTATFKSPAGG
jgi:hypothetical protein